MIRICWQSFVDPEGAHRRYSERVRLHVDAALDPGTTVDMIGMNPPVSEVDVVTELRAGLAALHNAIAAERVGYDAIIISHFQEPLLGELRASVDIPVVPLGETSLLHACTIGRSIGLVTIDPRFIPWHKEQVARHGLERRVVGVAALQISPLEFASLMDPGPANDAFVAQFSKAAEPLLDAGADVLVPAGGLPSMALAIRPVVEVDGARVVDIMRVTVKYAECAVKLARLTGLGPSRRGAFAKPSAAALEQLSRHAGGPLADR